MIKEDAILGAAIRLLNENPRLSMAELAAGIGVSRATLHRHFATRDALLHQAGLQALARWERTHTDIDLAGATGSGDAAVLAATMRTLLRGHLETIEEYGFALSDHYLIGQADLMEWSDRLEDREIAFIAAAQRAGLLRGELPPRWISDALYGLLVGMREGLRRGDFARRDAEELLYTTFTLGVTTFTRGVGLADGGTGA
jgi:AcrR family transcriptional regulator